MGVQHTHTLSLSLSLSTLTHTQAAGLGPFGSCNTRVPDSPLVHLQPCAHVLPLDCTIDRVLARTNCPLCRHRFRGVQIANHEDAPFVNQSRLAVSWPTTAPSNHITTSAFVG